jgi:PAS domain S-box-containing protein
MPDSGFLALVHNASLLLAMALVYDLATTRLKADQSRLRQVLVGLVLGGIGVAVMLSSWQLEPGIVFDTRSILLGVAGLYFGTIPTVAAMAVTAAFRIWMGGAATVTGVSVIVASGSIGLLWRYRRRPRLADLRWAELYGLGISVHLAMLVLMLLLPWTSALRVVSHITLPVLLIYPPATAALGLLLANRLRRERSAGVLRESEERLRATFYGIGDGVIATDAQGRISRLNRAAEALTGWTEIEAAGRPAGEVLRLLDETTREAASDPIGKVLGRREAEVLGTRTVLAVREGAERPIRASVSPVFGCDGGVAGSVAILRDQTAERAKDAAYRERESLFRAVFDQAVVGMAHVDTATGAFLRVNQRYADIVGFSREELASLRFQDVTHPEDVTRDVARMDELAAGRISEFTVDKRYLRKDGRVVWGSLAVSPMWAPGDPPTTNISMVLDITERKRAEAETRAAQAELCRLLAEADRSRQALLSVVEDQRAADTALRQSEQRYRQLSVELEKRVLERTTQLEEANKELEAFSYSVSHDLRAPLRAIDGFSRMIVEDHAGSLDSEGHRLLGVVSANARRMAHLIDDLLRLSRLGRSEIRLASVDMAALARTAFEDVVEDPKAREQIDFRVGELPRVEGDPALLRQAWINLLSNAVKFSALQERPVVEVEGRVEGHAVVYSVKDNGAGFNMAYSGKLFGVFQRLHGPSEFEGTGVGLALVRRIVLRHGGRVWAEGAIGQGATFSFSLPVS